MKKSMIPAVLCIILFFTGCSPASPSRDEQPVFPAVIKSNAMITVGDERYCVLLESSSEKTVFTLSEPVELSGMKITLKDGSISMTVGEMTFSEKEERLPDSFAVDTVRALSALSQKGVFVPESGCICVFADEPTAPPVYTAGFDDSGKLLCVKDETTGLTVLFG